MVSAEWVATFLVTASALALGAGYYWGDDQEPLYAIKGKLTAFLYARGDQDEDGLPLPESATFLQVIGWGVDCGVCSGQWAAFGLSWVVLDASPLDGFNGFLWWLVVAVALNVPNFLGHRFNVFQMP